MKSKSRGFTLIELLVVIAIIGLLASIILASLNTARSKGADAAAKGDFDNIRTQSAIYYDTYNGYASAAVAAATSPLATNCAAASSLFTDPNVAAQITSANSAEGAASVLCSNTANLAAWMVIVPLKNPVTAGDYWCVDSTGDAKEAAWASGAKTAC